MVFAHVTEASLLAAVALVNSAEPPDTLTTPAQLDAFFVAHRYSGDRTHDDAELAAVRALRAPLRARTWEKWVRFELLKRCPASGPR